MLFKISCPIALLLCGHASAATVFPASNGEFSVRNGATIGTPTVENNLHTKKQNAGANNTDRFSLIRFDSPLFGSSATSASFQIRANTDDVSTWQGTYGYNVWGVIDGDAQDELVDRTTYDPDGTGTLYANTAAQIDTNQVVSLGTFSNVSAGTSVDFTSAALLSFIQADTNGTVTLVLTRFGGGNTGNSVFYNTAGAPDDASKPQLVVIPEPGTLLLGCLGIPALLLRRRR